MSQHGYLKQENYQSLDEFIDAQRAVMAQDARQQAHSLQMSAAQNQANAAGGQGYAGGAGAGAMGRGYYPEYTRTSPYNSGSSSVPYKNMNTIFCDFLIDLAKFNINIEQIVMDDKSRLQLERHMNFSRSTVNGYTKLVMSGPVGPVTISDAVVPKFTRFDMDKYMEKTDEKLP